MSAHVRALSITIGVNGIGMGHSARQSGVAEYLRDRGHTVQIITNGRMRVRYFRDLGFPTWDAWMPTLIARRDRIRSTDAVRANLRQLPSGIAQHLALRRAVHESGVPDVFITDYEPNVPRLAYHFGRPLISVDQQSKYRHLDLPRVGRYARTAEEQRLRYFTPRADRFFICSFVELNHQDSRLEVIAPVVPDLVRSAAVTSESLAIAYFSRYFQHGPARSVRALAETFRRHVPHQTLRVYAQPTDLEDLRPHGGGNVEICPFDREAFVIDLARSDAIFSNAGFNLIGEAFVLGKPVHLIPLPTYDQHWCASVVAQAGLGTSASRIEQRSVLDFLDRRQDLTAKVVHHRALHLTEDPRVRIAAYVESLCEAFTPAARRPAG